jgi:hypothetical protein
MCPDAGADSRVAAEPLPRRAAGRGAAAPPHGRPGPGGRGARSQCA